MSLVSGVTDGIESKYYQMMAKIKEKKAEAEIENEKAEFEQAWEDFKAEADSRSDELQAKVVNSWKAFEKKANSLLD